MKFNSKIFSFPPAGGEIMFQEDGTILGQTPKETDYIVMDVTNLSDFCISLLWAIRVAKTELHTEVIKTGLLPGLRTRVAVPMAAFLGTQLFFKRTPGKLKTLVQGNPTKFNDIKWFSIAVDRTPAISKLQIHDVYISDKEPEEYPLAAQPLVDSLGQKLSISWKDKTENEEALIKYLQKEYEKPLPDVPATHSKYGGVKKKQFAATGYFRLQKDDGTFWLVDPEGCAFYSIGIDCIGVGSECAIEGNEKLCEDLQPEGYVRNGVYSWARANLIKVFGDNWFNAWCKIMTRRLKEWGVNTIASWSDPRFITYAKMPYVYSMNGYPKAKKNIFRDFPDVFDPVYEEDARHWAKQLLQYKDDPYLLGYFMNNEPNWAFVNRLNIGYVMFESSEQSYSKDKCVEWLKAKYHNSLEEINKAWSMNVTDWNEMKGGFSALNHVAIDDLKQFGAIMTREYIRIPALAARAVLPHHLNLGVRYGWFSDLNLAAGQEFVDIFCFNCYHHDPHMSMFKTSLATNMPVMASEFHFGALDRGLDGSGIVAVETQEDRGKAYRYYVERCAAQPMCVGTHYFQLLDQPYLGRFDGENYQFGLIDVCWRPYAEMEEAMKITHDELYDVRLRLRPVTSDRPEPVEPVFY